MDGIPSWAVPGAKVVCIDNSRSNNFGRRELQLMAIYTIAAVRIQGDGKPACKLSEVRREVLWIDATETVYFHLSRFRPLVDDDTEASIYRSKNLHIGAPKRETAEV